MFCILVAPSDKLAVIFRKFNFETIQKKFMAQKVITQFLKKAALDISFRELILTNPDKAFEGFDLSETEKAIIKIQKPELSNLVATAINDIISSYDTSKLGDEQDCINFVTDQQSVQIRPIIVIPPPPVTINPVVRPTPTPTPQIVRSPTNFENTENLNVEEQQMEIDETIKSIQSTSEKDRFEHLLKLMTLVENFPTFKK
jgi:hypothetical protein